MKLIQTKDYLLLIDEEAEIKKGDYILEKESIINIFPDYLTDLNECSKIIAYHSLTKEAKELDLPLLPPFENEVNINKLAETHAFNWYEKEDREIGKQSFIEGYKVAQSKQFSLEDMEKAFEYGKSLEPFDCFEDFIQSLSTQQLPSEFIPEIRIINQDYRFNEGQREELKTITNQENKEVLVGTYKY